MFSLNVPVPGRVEATATRLAPALSRLDTVRNEHTLVVKRFEADPGDADRLGKRVRRALEGAPAVEASVTGIGAFADPVAGPGPVVYLAVESPGLVDLHGRLVDAFGAIAGLEGSDYVPHVTLGRGGPPAAVDAVLARSVEPVTWPLTALELYDARHRERVTRVPLPR